MNYTLATPYDFYSTFDDLHYCFQHLFQEQDGQYSVEKDGKIILMVNVLGVRKEDLDVKVDNDRDHQGWQIITVKGKTNNEAVNREFSVFWQKRVKNSIKKLDGVVENGVLTLTLEFNEPVKPSVEISVK